MDKQEKQEGSEPHVRIFGKDCQKERHDHHHCNIVGGMMVLLVGVLVLFHNIGAVPWNIWDYIWPFWPVLLILVGFHMILGHNYISDFIVALVALAVLGFIILHALISINSPLVNNLPADWINFVNNLKFVK